MRLLMSYATIVALGGLALFIALGPVKPVQAQEDEIRLLSQRAESHFPDSVRFFIEAAGPDEINDIRVYLKTIGQTSRSSYRQVEFEPGVAISGEAELLSGGNNYFPPGTRMAYYFELRDSAGRVLRTEEEVFVYLDNRFEWLTVSEGLITVYYNNSLVERRAQHVLETAGATLERMGPVLGVNPEHPLHIVTYHDYRDMIGALPFRSRATREQLLTAGMAFDEERVLMVYSGGPGVTGTTAHEFTHLLVGDALGRAYSQVPAWLNEGLAEYGDFTGDDNFNDFLIPAIRADKVRPLWHQGSFSGTPQDILIAYGQGKSVVEYLVANFGEAKMAELMQAIARTLDIDQALKQVYNLDQYELDSAWRRSLGLEPLPRPQDVRPTPRPTATALPPPTTTPPETVSAIVSEAVPEPTPAPVMEMSPETLQPAPTAALEPTPEPSGPVTDLAAVPPTPVAELEQTEAGTNAGSRSQGAPGGCSTPAPLSGNLGGELAMLFLLVSPVAMLAGGRCIKRRRESRRRAIL